MPNILFYDLETSPSLGYTWRKYDQTVLKFERETVLMSISWSWGNGKTEVLQLCDFDSYNPADEDSRWDDSHLVKHLYDLFEQADVIVGHNVKSFDNRIAHTQFMKHHLGRPSPAKTIDTLKIARKNFRFMSNKLDDLGHVLGLGRKVKHEGLDLWFKCMAGDAAAWERMRKYAKQDVVLLKKIFKKLRPYIDGFNIGSYKTDHTCCPVCGWDKLVKWGYAYTETYRYQRYKCGRCGKYIRSRFSEKRENPAVKGV